MSHSFSHFGKTKVNFDNKLLTIEKRYVNASFIIMFMHSFTLLMRSFISVAFVLDEISSQKQV